ncbi:MAG TPA: hypothetical protein VIV15_16720 [Anaerolineales bacterium]
MRIEILEHHRRPPSAPVFMTRALLPSSGLRPNGEIPSIIARWSGLQIEEGHLTRFRQATGQSDRAGISILYPHVLGFRLQMSVLTHRAFPLPIWKALQIRNRFLQHARIEAGGTFELETRLGPHRLVDKGAEIDLVSCLSSGSQCYWGSTITYFYRGRFDGKLAEASSRTASPDVSSASVVDRFPMPRSGGWAFGRLTGDYNGIHTWSMYARLLGFRAAFLHPQRAAESCLTRLRAPRSEAQTLDLWIKGPVFYGADVVLSAAREEDEIRFGLALAGDHRAAIVGAWRGDVDPD